MKIVYVDMDSVLVDFQSGIDALTDDENVFKDDLDDNAWNIFKDETCRWCGRSI